MVNGPALRAPRPWLSARRVMAVVTLAVALAGCTSAPPPAATPSSTSTTSTAASSSTKPDHPLPDPAALLKQSSAATKKLTSAHLALSVTGKLEQLPVKTLEADLTNEHSPEATGKATITMMGADVDIRFVVFERRLYMALPQSDWRDYGPASAVFDIADLLNPDTGLANLLADFIDPQADARETVGGHKTVRISGKVTAEAVNKLVPLDVGKKTPCTVWIQESDEHQLVQVELEPSKGDAVQLVLSNWNAPVRVEKPAGR